MASLFTYIIPIDDGAAPNPYHGACTLAICKPVIRRTAKIGDWVVGLGSRRAPTGNLERHVVYAMKVEKVLTLQEYDESARDELRRKIPNFKSDKLEDRLGDCIYDYSSGTDNPVVRKSVHNSSNRKTDLSGKNVLVSKDFYYFGRSAIPLPSELHKIVWQGQGHRRIKDQAIARQFERWIRRRKRGINGKPDWKVNFNSITNAAGCRAKCSAQDRCSAN